MLSTQGVFLNIESRTKFINMTTVLEMYKDQWNNGATERDIFEKYNSSNIDNPRMTIISSHNSKSYQIDGMTSEFTPDTYTFKLRDGSSTSMTEYFFKRYKIKLQSKQPLLYVNYNSGDRVYLPAQLCNEASLPKDFTSDAFKMRELQPYKITSAEERKKKILKLVSKFLNDEVFA